MDRRTYHLLDVFTDRRFGGNQLAVFIDGKELTTEQMQAVAAELNLSETVFVVPPDDPDHNFRLRIFTPGREMEMAGHPTVGTAYLLSQIGKLPVTGEVIFEEGVGPVPVRLEANGHIRMTQPLPQFGQVQDNLGMIAEMLSLPEDAIRTDVPAQVVSGGVPFLYVPLANLDAVKQLSFRVDVWEKHFTEESVFVFVMEAEQPQHTARARMFAPPMNIREDPATGAACGPFGAYLVHHKLVTPEQGRNMVIEQGYEMGRPSLIGIHIDTEGDAISNVAISGTAVMIGEGKMVMPQP